jgi:hypothetical protein
MTGDPRWPNLFLVGVGKGGTSSLWYSLAQHPDIHMSTLKEPHFFSDARPTLFTGVKEESAYLKLFAGARNERVLGEASVSYFWDPDSPHRIARACPDAKILVILRHPIERAYSHYWHAVRNGRESRSFATAVDQELAGQVPAGREPYVARSLYSEPLERYLSVFAGNVYVLFFEDLVHDPAGELKSLFKFIGVEPDRATALVPTARNRFALPKNRVAARFVRSRNARVVGRLLVPAVLRPRLEAVLMREREKPRMPPVIWQRLRGFYAEDHARLELLLGRPVSWKA